jgi:hypothetical protein
MNFSYDIRKTARSIQNYLVTDKQPELTVIRNATTTDQWGPTTKQMDAVKDLFIKSEPEFIVGLIMGRIKEYSVGGEDTMYTKAVHYLNMGSEWIIVMKCLKLLEYLIVTMDDDVIRVIKEYMNVVRAVGDYKDDEDDVRTKALQKKEQHEALLKKRDELIELVENSDKRDEHRKIYMKLQSQGSIENQGERRHDDTPSYMAGFKFKQLDRHKMVSSNLKSEIRNELGHSIQKKKSLPGFYSTIGTGGESLFDDDDGQQNENNE